MLTYGPHRPEDNERTVVVGRDRWNPETVQPIHPGLLAQRKALNNLAAGTARPLYGVQRD